MITLIKAVVNPPHPHEVGRIQSKLDQARRNLRRCSSRRMGYWFTIEEKLARRQARLRGAWVPGIVADWETASLV